MTPSTPPPALAEQIQLSIDEYRRLKYFNQILGGTLAIAGIVLGLISTLYGIHGEAKPAAGFAASSATIQAIMFAYPLESRSKFYRKLAADGQNLLLDLNVNRFQEDELKLIEAFKSMRSRAAAEEPEGKPPENLEGIEKSIANVERLLAEYKKLKEQVGQDPKKNGKNASNEEVTHEN